MDEIELVRSAFEPIETILASHDALYSPDWVGHFPGMPPLDAVGHLRYSEAMQSAFPDLERSIDDLVAGGDKIVVRWSARGTHTGDFQGIAGSNKVITSSGITIFRVADG